MCVCVCVCGKGCVQSMHVWTGESLETENLIFVVATTQLYTVHKNLSIWHGYAFIRF